MKTEYKSDLKKNYLVVEPEEDINSGDYDVRMMEQNQIQGFLPMQVRRLDGSCNLYYEITSMQQLDLAYEKKLLQSTDIRHIFSEVKDILESARKYLLRPGQILLDPRYIYTEMETGRISVCYLPMKENSFSVLPLAEFILKKLNHEDPEAVSLGYDFYQKATLPNFSLLDTLHETLSGLYREGSEDGSMTGGRRRNGYRREEDGKTGYKETGYREKGNSETEYRRTEGGREYRADHVRRNTAGADSREEYHGEKRAVKREESSVQRHGSRGQNGGRTDARRQDVRKQNTKEQTNRNQGVRREDKKKSNKIVQAVHPAILILTLLLSAVLGVLLYFQWLGFTETGGLFFILLSAAILANRFWKKRKEEQERRERIRENNRNKRRRERENERKRNNPEWEQDQQEENRYLEEMRKLQMELYGSGKEKEM